MRRAITCLSLVGLLSISGFSQSTTFDVADVHASAKSTNRQMGGGSLRGGRYELRNATMLDLITIAYGIEADKVLGGPSWLEFNRYDVIAKAPNNTPQDELKLMLQGLLADRFKLVVHKDSKPVPAFILSLGKGKPKLKEADGSGTTGCQAQPSAPEPGVIPLNVASCHNVTMEAFAQVLRQMAGGYVTSPAVDQTGLKGGWDFDVKWTGRGQLAQAGADGISLFDAIDRQLGLKLEPGKVEMPVIIVDSANDKPTPNPAEVTTSLPAPPPAEFEVADIKPTMPGVNGTNIRLQPNGRIDVQGATMKMLMQGAWNINSDELMAGGPKWLDTTRWDIVAKAVTAAAPGTPAQFDIDALRLMLRNLLIDRFKIQAHMEERPVTAYVLLAVKPKLQKADPLGRTGWKEGPAPASKDPRETTPILSRLVTCTNMTIAQFADLLPSMASGYLQTPVQDMTGIEGAYDFTLSFSPIGAVRGGGGRGGGDRGGQPGPPATGTSNAEDPSGALSLFDALTRQLGLKLEMQKRPLPVLVIDHIEEKPTEN
jgi:uncharacterized protein (TIGR03435 family)